MVKKTVVKINTKRKEIEKRIDEKVKDPAKIIKDCNTRLATEPNNPKVKDWREDALSNLDQGIMGLPYLVGQLQGLVTTLETELAEKPKKSTPELVEFIAANRRFTNAVGSLHERKKEFLDASEAFGLLERIKF
jgi:hypothetical protein